GFRTSWFTVAMKLLLHAYSSVTNRAFSGSPPLCLLPSPFSGDRQGRRILGTPRRQVKASGGSMPLRVILNPARRNSGLRTGPPPLRPWWGHRHWLRPADGGAPRGRHSRYRPG